MKSVWRCWAASYLLRGLFTIDDPSSRNLWRAPAHSSCLLYCLLVTQGHAGFFASSFVLVC